MAGESLHYICNLPEQFQGFGSKPVGGINYIHKGTKFLRLIHLTR